MSLRDDESERPAARRWPFRFYPLDYATMVGFLAYSSSVTATPICLVAISRELSLTLSQAGSLEAMRGILVLVTLLAGGFIAAKLGKVRALGWSSLLLGVGMVWYSVAPAYGVLLLAFSVLGLGSGVVEALINPLVQELHPDDSGRYLNIINAFWSIGVLLTMLGTGEALNRDISWRAIMATLGGVSFFSGVLFLALRRSEDARDRASLLSVLREKRAILRSRRFWMFSAMMFLGGSAEGAFTYWSASWMQLHHGAPPRSAGLGVALFAAGMIAARLAFGWLIPQRRLWHLILGSALAGVVISPAIPLIGTLALAYVALFLAGVSVACFWPSLQAYAVDRLSLDPTGVFILLSCGGVAGFASVSWIMGIVGDRFSLQASFWIMPFYFVALVAFLLVERRRAMSLESRRQ